MKKAKLAHLKNLNNILLPFPNKINTYGLFQDGPLANTYCMGLQINKLYKEIRILRFKLSTERRTLTWGSLVNIGLNSDNSWYSTLVGSSLFQVYLSLQEAVLIEFSPGRSHRPMPTLSNN